MIQVEYKKLLPTFFTTDTTDYLLGVNLNYATIEIKFKALWSIPPNVNTLVTFASNSILLADEDSVPLVDIWENSEFKIGDIVTITSSLSNNVTTGAITSFSADGSTAYFNATTFVSEVETPSVTITGVTPMTGVTYKYNFIENNGIETFNCFVDNNENKYTLSGISSTSYTALNHQGIYKSNKIGTVEIKSTGVLNEYIIKQVIPVGYPTLADQLTDLENNISPEWYFDSNCLKHIYEISLHKTLANPNYVHKTSASDYQLGNSGFDNENFNGGAPEYTLVSTTFKNALGDVIDNLEYDKVNTVVIVINSANSRFANEYTKFLVNHQYIPDSYLEHTNTTTDLETNFMFDYAYNISGISATNGFQYGTNKQVIKDFSIVHDSASQQTITVKIDLSSNYKLRLADSDGNFCIRVIVQDHTKQTEASDIVSIRACVSNYILDVSDDTLCTLETTFISHPDDELSTAVESTDAGLFVEDWQIAKTILAIKKNEDAILKNLELTIYATHATYGDFTLETKLFNTEAAPIVSDIQVISISGMKGYKMGSGNIFNEFSFERKSSLDDATYAYYEIIYPFKIRWEDFKSLSGVSPQFYNPLEKQSGYNNDWARFYDGTGWLIKYKTKATVTKDEYDNETEAISDLTAHDYDDAEDWTYDIKSYDYSTGTEITGNVLLDGWTTIKVFCQKILGIQPDVNTITALIGVAPTNNGGTTIIREVSNVHEFETDTCWRSIVGGGLLKVEKVGSDYILSAILDNDKLRKIYPTATTFDITARIDKPIFENEKAFQGGEVFLFQGGETFILNL
jgi:hypothetical protein